MEIQINTDNWSLGDFADFQDLATQGGSIRTAVPLMVKLIDSWSLAGDPHDNEWVMKNVNLTQWKEVQKAVNDALTVALDPKK